MSVRRLAAETVQPASFAFTADNQSWAEQVIARYPAGRQASAVIPILWRAQEQQGWVTRAAIEAVARMLGMAYIRVLEVATFYTQFLLKPVGSEAHIIVCGTTPCMLRGAGDLLEVCHNKIAHDALEVSADGKLSWEEAECLGACVNAPMIMIGNDTYEDLSVARFEEIVETFRAGNGKSIPVGTQVERQFSAAQGGATTLLERPTAERTYKPFPPPPPPAAPAAAPVAAPAAPAATAAAALPPAAPAAPQSPTNKGRGSETAEESAPALKGPPGSPKVSEAKAEGERASANASANANGKPNAAMREQATGAESPAGKVDGGKSVKKVKRLFEPPAGKSDDLTLIMGIGPAIGRTLNDMGITTWRQVADLTEAQIEQVEAEAGFRGRATKNNWLHQADVLDRGGVEEYRKVFGRDPK
ncbi:MAG: NADH-quinone oxidoreductase subunit NuoE [Devosia sp.]